MDAALEVKDYLLNKLVENDVVIPDEYKDVFNNHIDVLAKRISENECVDVDVTEMEKELSKDSLSLAREILVPIFEKFKVSESKTEIALFALYINLAKKEELNNG